MGLPAMRLNDKGVKPLVSSSGRIVFVILAVALLSGCASGQAPTAIPTIVYPDSSAVVQVTVISKDEFTLSNHSALPVYHQVFPTELLPLIDWAPCETDETCRQIQILPSQSLTFRFEEVAERATISITVFWWQRESDPGQHNPEYRFPPQISFPAP